MIDKIRDYTLVSCWLETGNGWQTEEVSLTGTYEDAGRTASARAHALDELYGDDHFWTVDLKNPVGESYFQLFHGRLS